MPLTHKGEEIKKALVKEYGEKKGEDVLYAGKNKGTFTGIDSASACRAYVDAAGKGDAAGLSAARDAIDGVRKLIGG